MNFRDMDGQLDFLGLISEYTDDQGAKVKVREPGVKRSRPIPPPEPEQMKLDFTVKDAVVEIEEPKPAPAVKPIEEPKPAPKEKPAPAVKPIEEPKPAPKEKPAPVPKPVKSLLKNKESKAQSEKPAEMLFKACDRCWCRDCKHNSRNEGVPRDICGTMMACPACKGCIEEDSPTICEIGNAKEGCMTRATEEGLVVAE